jgi:hypothetical protein
MITHTHSFIRFSTDISISKPKVKSIDVSSIYSDISYDIDVQMSMDMNILVLGSD